MANRHTRHAIAYRYYRYYRRISWLTHNVITVHGIMLLTCWLTVITSTLPLLPTRAYIATVVGLPQYISRRYYRY
jgi:hypothetical protein